VSFVITSDVGSDAAQLAYRSLFRNVRLIALAGLIVGAVFIFLGSPEFAVVVFAASVATLIVGSGPVQRWMAGREIRSVIGSSVAMTIDEEGIHARSAIGTGEVPWISMTEVREGPRTVMFMRDRVPVGYIPESAFESPSQRSDIIQFARARMDAVRRTAPETPPE
jgi:hypothetical protein